MKFISKIAIIFVAISIFSCKGQTSDVIKNIDPISFSKELAMTKEPQLIDVRTPEEFNAGHILDAINIDWLGSNFDKKIQELDKSQPIFVYCKSGARSAKAASKLAEWGFKKIYSLDGGTLKWDAAGLSKPTDRIKGLSSQAYSELLNTDKKVLVDFYAKWCAPCKKMSPYLDKMEKELAGKVLIVRLNADENPTLIKEMKIVELPTLLIYENKGIKWQHTGYISEEDLKKQLQ